MTEDEMDRLTGKIADAITAKRDTTTRDAVYSGTLEDLAKTVTTAMRAAARRGTLPKSILDGL